MIEWILAVWLAFGFFLVLTVGLIILLAPLFLSIWFFWFLFKLLGKENK